MGDYAEQQREELEALESIYPEEFTVISSENPVRFRINVHPDDVEDSEGSNNAGEHLVLTFTLPDEYPDVAPIVEIEGPGLESQHEDEVRQRLLALAEENLGMVMCFLLASDAKEWLDNHREHLAQIQEANSEKKRKEQEEADRLRHGTLVTRENFVIWRDAFEEEQRAKAAKQGQLDIEKEKRPTGRQLFEKDKSLASSDAKYMEEGDAVVSVDHKVPVDESLFEDMDDLDIDDK